MNVSESVKDFGQRLRESLHNSKEFLRDVRKELNNVSWPSRRELTSTTMVVIVAVFFFGFYLYVIDLIVHAGMQKIFALSSP
jgi:preprotein translocase subunit SecE